MTLGPLELDKILDDEITLLKFSEAPLKKKANIIYGALYLETLKEKLSHLSKYELNALFEGYLKENNLQQLELCFKAGLDVNLVDKDRRSLLFRAVRQQKVAAVELLLKNGANANFWDPHTQSSVLCLTVSLKNKAIAALLLAHGAKTTINQSDSKLRALTIAALLGDDEMISLLIQHGGSPNFAEEGGYTPLMNVVETSRLTANQKVKTLQCLLSGGADINFVTTKGRTCLLLAATKRCFGETSEDSVVDCLVANGAHIFKALTAYEGPPHLPFEIFDYLLGKVSVEIEDKYKDIMRADIENSNISRIQKDQMLQKINELFVFQEHVDGDDMKKRNPINVSRQFYTLLSEYRTILNSNPSNGNYVRNTKAPLFATDNPGRKLTNAELDNILEEVVAEKFSSSIMK